MRILTVEDNPAIREALVTALDLLGHQVREAQTLAEAQAILDAGDREIDAVICDGRFPSSLGTPEENFGVNFVKGCIWRGLRAILYTADDATADEARREGIPVLLKPAPIAEIIKILKAQQLEVRE